MASSDDKRFTASSATSFFRELFRTRPDLLWARNNDAIVALWLAAHPDQTTMPKSVRANLNTLKNRLRKTTPRGPTVRQLTLLRNRVAACRDHAEALGVADAVVRLKKALRVLDARIELQRGLERSS